MRAPGCVGRRRTIVIGSCALFVGLAPAWLPSVSTDVVSPHQRAESPHQRAESPHQRAESPLDRSSAGSPRPNIVLITTDDQRADDIRYMPRTRKLIGRRGTTFRGFSPDPLCCPARASILTGQLAHNHGVLSNDAPHGGFQALPARRSLAVWLERAGYHTVFMGKYLNGIEDVDGRRQPGWQSWHASTRGVYNYWSFWVNHGDGPQQYDAYQTDYFTQLAVKQIRRLSTRHRPFFLWQSYLAPHKRFDEAGWAPPSPAPRHIDRFPQEPLVTRSSPAFNERDLSDKPPWLRQLPLLDRSDVAALTRLHRQRIRSLQAVDQGVARMIRALRGEGELRNTLVIFMSDNGLLLGEHRFDAKNVAFEPAVRVPLMIRGPGLPVGRRTASIGTPVDVAATIVRAARVVPSVVLDGRDLRAVARERTPSVDTLLIQAGVTRAVQGAPRWFWRGVRTHRYTFVRYPWSGFLELYDRRHDPAHLVNVAGDPRYDVVQSELRERLAELKSCAGAECSRRFGAVSPPGD